MSKHLFTQNLILEPAPVDFLLDRYYELFKTYKNTQTFGFYKKSSEKLQLTLPLRKHDIHGYTAIFVKETYDKHGFLTSYLYEWKPIRPTIQDEKSFLSIWEHDTRQNKVDDEEKIHLHYYVPNDITKVKSSPQVQSLKHVLQFIEPFIMESKVYYSNYI